MSRMIGGVERRVIAVLGRVALLGAVSATGACVAENSISLIIQQGQVPVMSGTTGCTVSADPSQLFQNAGILDLSVRRSYRFFPLYRSEVLTYSRASSGRPETRGIVVDGAHVSLHVNGATGPAPTLPMGVTPTYDLSTTTFVAASTSTGPGFGVGGLEIISGEAGTALAMANCAPTPSADPAACPVPTWPTWSSTMTVSIRPFGHTMGGIQVEGGTYNFALTLCCHCLVSFPASADDSMRAGPDCSSTTAASTDVCDLGQDRVFDCRSCSGSNTAACQPPGYRRDPMVSCVP